MTVEEVKKYFITTYRFEKKTGMKHTNILNWTKKGYVPIKSQIWLEKFTNGELKASFQHL